MKVSQFREKDKKKIMIVRLLIALIVIVAILIGGIVLKNILGEKADAGLSFIKTKLSSVKQRKIPKESMVYNGHTYHVYIDKADSWEEAKDFCEKKGGYLAALTDEAEDSYVYNYMLMNGAYSAYLGCTDADAEGTWTWLDGSAMEYAHWSDGEPNGAESENYGLLGSNYGGVTYSGWFDVSGTDSYAFICEWDEELIDTSKALVIGQAGYSKKSYSYNGHHYEVFEDADTWEMAERFCEIRGGHLATVNSAEENTAICEYLQDENQDCAFFGLTDVNSEGSWYWINGEEVLFANWNEGEPNGAESENYGMYYYSTDSGVWNDGNFDVNAPYICEWEE